MLQVITQSGMQKLHIENYYVAKTVADNPSLPEPTTFSIYCFIPDVGAIEIAQYDDQARAVDVFKAMVDNELAGRPYRLPYDDSESVEQSSSGELFY